MIELKTKQRSKTDDPQHLAGPASPAPTDQRILPLELRTGTQNVHISAGERPGDGGPAATTIHACGAPSLGPRRIYIVCIV